jgi:methylthioribulose 1-phosphate dehydratase/enolase-phosphatase E1
VQHPRIFFVEVSTIRSMASSPQLAGKKRKLDGATAVAADDNGGYHMEPHDTETCGLLCELCALFYTLGWVGGTGGSISVKTHGRIYMSPSAVQKERMAPRDIYILDENGEVLRPGLNPHRSLKLSQCHPLFMACYNIRGCGAVIHTHSIHAVMVTLLYDKEFRCTHLEMIKGVEGHGYLDELVVPIIDNTPQERDLEASLAEAVAKYPKATAVLVRRHGVYIWGKDWISAKTQAECYDYLFNVAVQMHQHGLDPNNASSHAVTRGLSNAQPKAIVLDIEGTTSSISFVHEVLFPYARKNVESFLKTHIKDAQVKALATELAKLDFPQPKTVDAELIAQALKVVNRLMDADVKSTPLKSLQGLIWESGFKNGTYKSHFFEDTVPALRSWHRRGYKIYIYSSGSIFAQKLLFTYSEAGDLTGLLSGHFDTTTGAKIESSSYEKIAKSIGVSPSEILFVTDVAAEAKAAISAGFSTI